MRHLQDMGLGGHALDDPAASACEDISLVVFASWLSAALGKGLGVSEVQPGKAARHVSLLWCLGQLLKNCDGNVRTTL